MKGDSFEDVISPYEDFDFQNQLYFSYVPKEYGNLDQLDIVIYTMIIALMKFMYVLVLKVGLQLLQVMV